MSLNKKSIVFFAPIFLWLSLEAFLRYYHFLGVILIILFGGLFFLLKQVVSAKFFSKDYFYFLTTPLLFIVSAMLFLSLIEDSVLQHGVILFLALLLALYFENVFLYNFQKEKYSPNAIENISSYINLVTFFFLAISFYALNILVGVSFAWLVFALVLVLSLILQQSFWVAGINDGRRYLYLLLLNFIMVEVFWSLAFLPTNFYLHGFLLTVSFYAIWGMSKASLLDILTPRLVRRYLIVALLASLAVILTANWF